MRKLSAQYIFDGKQYHRLALLTIDDNGNVVALEKNEQSYVEQAGVEFFNGVICYERSKKSDIVLLENFDFEKFQKTDKTTRIVLVSAND
ncbi:MAG: hypothetical protein MJ198_03600 [Bacteroidales bacterium]|nr:hypothetical protein [Bacteroidales bacterium]